MIIVKIGEREFYLKEIAAICPYITIGFIKNQIIIYSNCH